MLEFALGAKPVIPLGDDVPGSYDSGGCEDPTVAYVDGAPPIAIRVDARAIYIEERFSHSKTACARACATCASA